MNELLNYFGGSLLRGGLIFLLLTGLAAFGFNPRFAKSRLFWYAVLISIVLPLGLFAPVKLSPKPMPPPEPVAMAEAEEAADPAETTPSPPPISNPAAGVKPKQAMPSAPADKVSSPAKTIPTITTTVATRMTPRPLSPDQEQVAPEETVAEPVAEPPSGLKLPGCIWCVYLAISLLFLSRRILQCALWRRRARRMPTVSDERVLRIFEAACAEIGLRPETVELHDGGPALPVPASGGLRHMRVFLPVEVIPRQRDEQLRMLMLHELYHLKRHDPLEVFLLACAGSFLWFNPFYARGVRRLALVREIECDEAVMRAVGNDRRAGHNYLEMMLDFFGGVPDKVPFGVGLSSGAKDLKERMVRVLNPAQYSRPALISLSAALLAVVIVSLFAVGERGMGKRNLEKMLSLLPETAQGVMYFNSDESVNSEFYPDFAPLAESLAAEAANLSPAVPALAAAGAEFLAWTEPDGRIHLMAYCRNLPPLPSGGELNVVQLDSAIYELTGFARTRRNRRKGANDRIISAMAEMPEDLIWRSVDFPVGRLFAGAKATGFAGIDAGGNLRLEARLSGLSEADRTLLLNFKPDIFRGRHPASKYVLDNLLFGGFSITETGGDIAVQHRIDLKKSATVAGGLAYLFSRNMPVPVEFSTLPSSKTHTGYVAYFDGPYELFRERILRNGKSYGSERAFRRDRAQQSFAYYANGSVFEIDFYPNGVISRWSTPGYGHISRNINGVNWFDQPKKPRFNMPGWYWSEAMNSQDSNFIRPSPKGLEYSIEEYRTITEPETLECRIYASADRPELSGMAGFRAKLNAESGNPEVETFGENGWSLSLSRAERDGGNAAFSIHFAPPESSGFKAFDTSFTVPVIKVDNMPEVNLAGSLEVADDWADRFDPDYPDFPWRPKPDRIGYRVKLTALAVPNSNEPALAVDTPVLDSEQVEFVSKDGQSKFGKLILLEKPEIRKRQSRNDGTDFTITVRFRLDFEDRSLKLDRTIHIKAAIVNKLPTLVRVSEYGYTPSCIRLYDETSGESADLKFYPFNSVPEGTNISAGNFTIQMEPWRKYNRDTLRLKLTNNTTGKVYPLLAVFPMYPADVPKHCTVRIGNATVAMLCMDCSITLYDMGELRHRTAFELLPPILNYDEFDAVYRREITGAALTKLANDETLTPLLMLRIPIGNNIDMKTRNERLVVLFDRMAADAVLFPGSRDPVIRSVRLEPEHASRLAKLASRITRGDRDTMSRRHSWANAVRWNSSDTPPETIEVDMSEGACHEICEQLQRELSTAPLPPDCAAIDVDATMDLGRLWKNNHSGDKPLSTPMKFTTYIMSRRLPEDKIAFCWSGFLFNTGLRFMNRNGDSYDFEEYFRPIDGKLIDGGKTIQIHFYGMMNGIGAVNLFTRAETDFRDGKLSLRRVPIETKTNPQLILYYSKPPGKSAVWNFDRLENLRKESFALDNYAVVDFMRTSPEWTRWRFTLRNTETNEKRDFKLEFLPDASPDFDGEINAVHLDPALNTGVKPDRFGQSSQLTVSIGNIPDGWIAVLKPDLHNRPNPPPSNYVGIYQDVRELGKLPDDKNGDYTGKWVRRFPGSLDIEMEGEYRNGIPCGTWKEYYPCGHQLRRQVEYREDGTAEYRSYYPGFPQKPYLMRQFSYKFENNLCMVANDRILSAGDPDGKLWRWRARPPFGVGWRWDADTLAAFPVIETVQNPDNGIRIYSFFRSGREYNSFRWWVFVADSECNITWCSEGQLDRNTGNVAVTKFTPNIKIANLKYPGPPKAVRNGSRITFRWDIPDNSSKDGNATIRAEVTVGVENAE
ncbi:MAG: M56 family metallopeptidase [Victivallaceae bacterium]|nr:M56 family metallopeptidase [Victivallaceae bacterium]